MTDQHVVLIGGGHTHALVLAALRDDPLAGARITLINPGPTAPYSGMLPGFVAGHYTQGQLEIDLAALAESAGASLVQDRVTSADPVTRHVTLASGGKMPFDVVSFDVGITTEMPGLPGFSEHGVPAKPLSAFAARWLSFRDGAQPADIAVIGGGVAGAELSLAMRHALKARKRDARVHLIDRSEILGEVPEGVRARLRRVLARNGIQIHEHAAIASVGPDAVTLENGKRIVSSFTVGAAGANPHDWIVDCGLALHEGFIVVDGALRAQGHEAIFAAGDCAHMSKTPRPKAGVYAVRQAPILTANLRSCVTGEPLADYVPQSDYLKLVSLGRKSALGVYRGIPFKGTLIWCLKDWIDRRFMAQF